MNRMLALTTVVVLSLLMAVPVDPPVAEAGISCEGVAHVSLYRDDLVEGHGQYGCSSSRFAYAQMRVMSRNDAGDVSHLHGLSCRVDDGTHGRIRCKSSHACKRSLMYRSRITVYYQASVMATDYSAWRLLC